MASREQASITPGLVNLVAPGRDAAVLGESLRGWIAAVEDGLGTSFRVVASEHFDGDRLDLVFVKSGGVEGAFVRDMGARPGPFVLLTTGLHNSLPAALEMAAWLRSHGRHVEVLHGEADLVVRRLRLLVQVFEARRRLRGLRLGLLGAPSDWLVASAVEPETARRVLGVELLELDYEQFLATDPGPRDGAGLRERMGGAAGKALSAGDVDAAAMVYGRLRSVVDRHRLDGFTIRCFDLLERCDTTACLALSFLNDEGIIAGCEGDVPALLSMAILEAVARTPAFQANPARIDRSDDAVVFAHCTVPWSMGQNVRLTTHFESGRGVGVRGKMGPGPVTVFRIGNDCRAHWVSEGVVEPAEHDPGLCRTQVRVVLDEGIDYFLERALGNHHVVVRGRHGPVVRELFRWL